MLGLAFGTGFDQDIRQAYEFLTTNYKGSGNKVYLFGFSRGAYAVRVLARLIQIAGVPDLSGISKSKRKQVIDDIYDKYTPYYDEEIDDLDKVLSSRK